MIIFGVEVSLVEVITAFSIISTIILLEVIAIMVLLLYQLRAAKRVNAELTELLMEQLKRPIRGSEKKEPRTTKTSKAKKRSKKR